MKSAEAWTGKGNAQAVVQTTVLQISEEWGPSVVFLSIVIFVSPWQMMS